MSAAAAHLLSGGRGERGVAIPRGSGPGPRLGHGAIPGSGGRGAGQADAAGEMRPGRSVPSGQTRSGRWSRLACRRPRLSVGGTPCRTVLAPAGAAAWLRAVLFAASGQGGRPWARLSEAGPALVRSPPSCLALALSGGTSEDGRPVGSTPWFCARSNPGSLALGWLPPLLALFRLKDKRSNRMTVKILPGVAVAL